MPAPDNLQVQTPGQPTIEPAAQQITTDTKAEPEYVGKHNGGGRYRIFYTPVGAEHGDWFSDFVAAGDGAKEAAQAEADRLNTGGAPFVKPADPAPAAPAPASAVAEVAKPAAQQLQARQQAVLTEHGWLCPELPARKE
ncbi:hypothetical protein [Pseudomonas sichuanensis]|uniref:hypothetical protein n=1 Tax=Pseudomonas sichuanensis TaxID=2213015 RepID=UPI001300898A|nr:hypothetical protein [Pseudomonas sichuanensis]